MPTIPCGATGVVPIMPVVPVLNMTTSIDRQPAAEVRNGGLAHTDGDDAKTSWLNADAALDAWARAAPPGARRVAMFEGSHSLRRADDFQWMLRAEWLPVTIVPAPRGSQRTVGGRRQCVTSDF